MKLVTSDAGRVREGFAGETNDCAVVALAHAAGIPYRDAHAAYAQAGRRPRRGTKKFLLLRGIQYALENRGMTVKPLPVPLTSFVREDVVLRSFYTRSGRVARVRRTRRVGGVTVAQFLRTLPKRGRFFLGSTTHAFAVVDGVRYDNQSRPVMRAKMSVAYEITPAPKSTGTELTRSDINELWARLDRLEGRARS